MVVESVLQASGTPTQSADIPLSPTLNLSNSQQIIVKCLQKTGSLGENEEALLRIHPDTDLTQLLINGGLDSHGMLVFKAALEAELKLQAPIPITALVHARTVQELEKEIFRACVAGSKSLLLTFSTEGSKTPIFLFPPGAGELHCWIELVRYLRDRPIYGLRLRGLQEDEAAFNSIEEMVEVFIDEMKKVVPRGPYALLGMCFGGNIVFELAKALETGGDDVVFAGGIDNVPNLAGQMNFGSTRFFIVDLLLTRAILSPEERDQMKQDLESAEPADFPQLIMRRFRTRLEPAGITRQRLEAWQRVFFGTGHMARNYVPDGKVASYTSFWAAPLAEWGITKDEWEERVRTWRALARSSSFHFIPGDHYTVLTGKHIDVFQSILNKQLWLCEN